MKTIVILILSVLPFAAHAEDVNCPANTKLVYECNPAEAKIGDSDLALATFDGIKVCKGASKNALILQKSFIEQAVKAEFENGKVYSFEIHEIAFGFTVDPDSTAHFTQMWDGKQLTATYQCWLPK